MFSNAKKVGSKNGYANSGALDAKHNNMLSRRLKRLIRLKPPLRDGLPGPANSRRIMTAGFQRFLYDVRKSKAQLAGSRLPYLVSRLIRFRNRLDRTGIQYMIWRLNLHLLR